MTVSIDYISAPPKGVGYNVEVEYDSTSFIEPQIVYSGFQRDWITLTTISHTSTKYTYWISVKKYSANYISPHWREAKVVFNGTNEVFVSQANGYSSIFTTQEYLSITLQGDNYCYVIKHNGKTIFEGITTSPTEDSFPEKPNIARIVESYVETTDIMSVMMGEWTELKSYKFDFFKKVGDEEIFKRSFYFFNDWSYKKDIYTKNGVLNEPVNGHITPNMTIPICIYNVDDSEDWGYSITQKDSEEGPEPPIYFEDYPTEPFTIYTLGVDDTIKEISIVKGLEELTKYTLKDCGQGALYYRNRYGAWDCFLIEGNIYPVENYAKDSFNDKMKHTNKVKITKSYDVHTGWMTDEESERFVFHILSSPTIYFVDFKDDSKWIPVNITNNECEIKKFRNGRKLVNYTISIQEAEDKTVKR